MTTSPFCSLYFSNLSCGTSSGAALGTAFCVCAVAGDFVGLCAPGCDGSGFCAWEAGARIKNPSNKTRLSNAFIKVSFQMDAHQYRLTLIAGPRSQVSPRNPI